MATPASAAFKTLMVSFLASASETLVTLSGTLTYMAAIGY